MSRFRTEIIGDATLILGDCREVLPTLGKFDAVVTDPPYGIGEARGKARSRALYGRITPKVRGAPVFVDFGDQDWDDTPISSDLLSSVIGAGKYAIVFGGNYYAMPPARCWLVWDKLATNDFADCELAWTNLNKSVRRIRYLWNGCMRAGRETRGDHPTQKPVGVMRWTLTHLPSDVRTICDPFMGSGTTGVAAVLGGYSFLGIEREERYFDAAVRRIQQAWKQPRLFEEPKPKPVQEALELGGGA